MNLRKNVKFVLAWNAMQSREPSTITKLAAMLEVDRGNLSRFLAGSKGSVSVTVEQVAVALGVTVTQLFTGAL